MSPYQHGEVFVLEDGAETDLDLGHYERFIDENMTARIIRLPEKFITKLSIGTPRRLSRGDSAGHSAYHR
jgi:hypothetical protein